MADNGLSDSNDSRRGDSSVRKYQSEEVPETLEDVERPDAEEAILYAGLFTDEKLPNVL